MGKCVVDKNEDVRDAHYLYREKRITRINVDPGGEYSELNNRFKLALGRV